MHLSVRVFANVCVVAPNDPVLEVTFEQLARANVDTRRISVIIPNDLVSGQNYWLGVIVDDDDSRNEVVEWNNATYIGIRVN